MCRKLLVALDFDHTVIDSNSDVEVQRLARGGEIPTEVRKLYSTHCWTNFMQKVFETLHCQGISVDQYKQCLQSQKFVPGMKELLVDVGQKNNIQMIIISDSNSLFIDYILKFHSINETVSEVFSNPAYFDASGCLRIRYYHLQNDCPYSSMNLCKGQVLTEYLNSKRDDGLVFDSVIYVGDGMHDLCPALRLRASDHVFVRKGYGLEKLISAPDRTFSLTASVHIWKTGLEILSFIRSLSDLKETV
ncbi:unnamed protein product [Soboliphyme baturini]|uniref:Pyridoxal phosphate phosphatase PHOSPHO2 n=1 Tax=Soboliphyme baturini TaxID=241478 RepID=A0A183IBR2_9BILA|nr:unnamed protein product [Soboliphyme baturini]